MASPQISTSRKGSVVANGIQCAEIGANILRKNGSAVDAAIAVTFCEGITLPQACGMGGGFFATIYNRREEKIEVLHAQHRAPIYSSHNLFKNRQPNDWIHGGLAVAVPGELKGLHALHDKYGKLEWAELVQPAIDLCENGFEVPKSLGKALIVEKENILKDRMARILFINPETNDVYKEGEIIRFPKLAKTLRIIAREKSDCLYLDNGTLINGFVDDISKCGGIITREDLINYRLKWAEPVKIQLPNRHTVYTSNAPSSGPVLIQILNTMSQEKESITSPIFYHRLIESFKYAYAKRTWLEDPDFNTNVSKYVQQIQDPDYGVEIRRKINDSKTSYDPKHYEATTYNDKDHGTAHICVLAPNGDAVSLTSSINTYFGSITISESTGIILNNAMDAFSAPYKNANIYGLPRTKNNFIEPGKMPLSSMTPTIVIGPDKNVELIIGAAGGPKIISSTAYTVIERFWLNKSIEEAIKAPRLHNQLVPMNVVYEKGFDSSIIEYLRGKGHNTTEFSADGFSAVTAIDGRNGIGVFDKRRGGSKVDFKT